MIIAHIGITILGRGQSYCMFEMHCQCWLSFIKPLVIIPMKSCGIKKYRIIILQSVDIILDEVIVSGRLRGTNRQNIRCWRCWDTIQTETTDRLQINAFIGVIHRAR